MEKRKIHWMNQEKLCWSKVKGGMGFRDLQSFDLAMLAKQGWKIIQNPKSLVTRVPKARYFPYFSFMKANCVTNPSYTWQSWMEGKAILRKGLVWRIEDGRSDEIITQNWIPTAPCFSIQDLRWFLHIYSTCTSCYYMSQRSGIEI